jgi:hypothetical protein
MAELAAASRSLGMELDGVEFVKGDKSPDRPAIAFLSDARGGHFAVLRPVGATGTMVQVIDPPHVPWITDCDRLLAARGWTGRILLPRERWSRRFAAPVAVAALGAIVTWAALKRRAPRRRVDPATPTVRA